MGSKLSIDRKQVRATYIATGSLTEAANAHGLKPATVRQWAKRENWETSTNALKLVAKAEEIQTLKRERGHPDAVPVCHAGDALADIFQNQKESFKSNMSQAMAKASEYIGTLPGDAILQESRKVESVMSVGSKLYGFGDDGTKAALSVNILNLTADSLTPSAQVIDLQ
jgi:transposase-like protein